MRVMSSAMAGVFVAAQETFPEADKFTISCQISPSTVLLKDNETLATFFPITNVDQIPGSLLMHICDEFNSEVERGTSNPIIHPLHIEVFTSYWFNSFAAVLLLGDNQQIHNSTQWQRECLGTFFIKPNYPGRSAHICTGEILVNSALRNKGLGHTLTEKFVEWAPKLGYSYVMFNLVYESNIAAKKILESLSFKRVGRLRNAAILKGSNTPCDGLIYGSSLVDQDGSCGVTDSRFDRIKYYLETGLYPSSLDRQGKSRLRASASHYRIENGKLLLKDREVIADPQQQLELSLTTHQENEHSGVNRITTMIAEKYHWPRIKNTVAEAIRTCPQCSKLNASQSRQLNKRARVEKPAEPPQKTVHPGDLDLGFSPRYYEPISLPFEEQSGEELAIARALIQANESEYE